MKYRFYLFILLFTFTIVRSSENQNNRQPAFVYYFNSFEGQNATLGFVNSINNNPNVSGNLGVRPVTMREINERSHKGFPKKSFNQTTDNTLNNLNPQTAIDQDPHNTLDDFDLKTATYLYLISKKN